MVRHELWVPHSWVDLNEKILETTDHLGVKMVSRPK